MLFGTDGIRGKVCLESCSDPVDALVNERKITPDLLWLVGHVLSMKVEKRSRVIIGWDNRPDNPVLVQALANALDDEEIEENDISDDNGINVEIDEENKN